MEENSVKGTSFVLTGFRLDLIHLMKIFIKKGYHFQEDIWVEQNYMNERYLMFSPSVKYEKIKNISLIPIKEYDSGIFKGLISIKIHLYYKNENFMDILKTNGITAVFQGYDGSWEGFPYYVIFSRKYKEKIFNLIKMKDVNHE